jgi:hypothetical protein
MEASSFEAKPDEIVVTIIGVVVASAGSPAGLSSATLT